MSGFTNIPESPSIFEILIIHDLSLELIMTHDKPAVDWNLEIKLETWVNTTSNWSEVQRRYRITELYYYFGGARFILIKNSWN